MHQERVGLCELGADWRALETMHGVGGAQDLESHFFKALCPSGPQLLGWEARAVLKFPSLGNEKNILQVKR